MTSAEPIDLSCPAEGLGSPGVQVAKRQGRRFHLLTHQRHFRHSKCCILVAKGGGLRDQAGPPPCSPRLGPDAFAICNRWLDGGQRSAFLEEAAILVVPIGAQRVSSQLAEGAWWRASAVDRLRLGCGRFHQRLIAEESSMGQRMVEEAQVCRPHFWTRSQASIGKVNICCWRSPACSAALGPIIRLVGGAQPWLFCEISRCGDSPHGVSGAADQRRVHVFGLLTNFHICRDLQSGTPRQERN